MMPNTLITIPISHYCEKARWALDRAGLRWTERAHLQVLHYFPAMWFGRSATVPVFVHDGGVLSDSTDILRWVDGALPDNARLYPPSHRDEIERLEAALGAGLGREGRLWMYHNILPHPELAFRYGLTGTPPWQQSSARLLYPLVSGYIRRRFAITDARAALALSRAEADFDDIAQRLADGREYLFADRFTAADLTFAALSAAVLLPERYGVPLPTPDELPETARAVVLRLREHPAGQFAMRMFATERGAVFVPDGRR